MRKKLDTRFPAARIKKIMQADEDVGKIAMAVPLLVSKALELFLQDLCDRTYEITVQRGAKTMNSLHLKHCVQSYNVFDFLRDIVSKVPDFGKADAGSEDRVSKRRKADECDNDSEEELKKAKNEVPGQSGTGRGRGRGRRRGRGRPRNVDRDNYVPTKFEDDPGIPVQPDDTNHHHDSVKVEEHVTGDSKDDVHMQTSSSDAVVCKFDLNMNLDENGDTSGDAAAAMQKAVASTVKDEEFLGWPPADISSMSVDALQASLLSKRQEEDEDYDNEDG